MRTYIVAEMSANHNQNLDIALKTVHAAKEAGADAIKIQTYTPDTITLDCDGEDFMRKGGLWDGYRLYDLYREAHTPWEWHGPIFEEARKAGIDCFSSPFDKTAADLLESFGNPIYKIASPEITDIPLIRYIASKGKPLMISTGIATVGDIESAIEACHAANNYDITLLKCTTAYPAPIEDANLLTIPDMRERFGVRVGLSDHTLGQDVAVAAVALGAEVVEKHFTADRSIGGPDSSFSMEPAEFASMVNSIRNVEKALGKVYYPADPSEAKGRAIARSLYVACDMKAGDAITEDNVRSVRPGHGLHPKHLPGILGRKVNRDLEKGTRFSLEFLN